MNRATVARTSPAKSAARPPRSWSSHPAQKSPNSYAHSRPTSELKKGE
ncbi:hypothetical protein [Veronia pacifica]|nr:hypothetical protein [Veronia pacifica]